MLSLNAADPPKTGVISKLTIRPININKALDVFMYHISLSSSGGTNDEWRVTNDGIASLCHFYDPYL
jgi:hypothetical protein